MATFDHLDGVFPTSAELTVGTSELTLEIPAGATAVYAENKTTIDAVASWAARSGTDIEMTMSTSGAGLIWSGPPAGGHRYVYLKSSEADTPVHAIAFSVRP